MTFNCSEIKSWLEICLKKEQITDIEINNLRLSEKGEGYVGDVIFVHATGKTADESLKEYDLVIKCSKNSKVLRETSPSKSLFENEIYFYETLLPSFTKFQLDRGVEDFFNSVPKYYGSFITEDREVFVLEDLTAKGYGMWYRKQPMTRKHIDLVVAQYAKFHAISVAMNDQFFEEYQNLIQPLNKLFQEFERRGTGMLLNFISAIEDVYQVLKGDLDEQVLSKWRNFGNQMKTDFIEKLKDYNGIKVVNHGDCWNNNFLFQNEKNNINHPIKVSIIDWQVAKLGPPVSDLAHFLFVSISSEDLEDFDTILNEYYSCFSNHLVKLKSDSKVYSKDQFFKDWKEYSKFGILFTSIAMKVCVRDSKDIFDMGEAAEQGDYTETFRFEVKNKTILKNRMIPIVKYVVDNNLI